MLGGTIRAVGFIGLGIMGGNMAGHIQQAGYALHVHNRTRAKAEPLIARGAVWHDTVADLVAACDAVITIVGYPVDVRQVYLGETGLIANARPGTLLIDMTTSNPSLARLIADSARLRGVASLDAPVSGGEAGAKDARLAIMVGGAAEEVARAMPLFEAMGRTIRHLGPAGAGQHAKAANQILVAAMLMGIAESVAYVKRSGLEPAAVLEVLGAGSAASPLLSVQAPKMIAGDYAAGSHVHHFLKDMGIAIEEAAAMGLDLPALDLSKSRFEELTALGYGTDGTQALSRLYEDDLGS